MEGWFAGEPLELLGRGLLALDDVEAVGFDGVVGEFSATGAAEADVFTFPCSVEDHCGKGRVFPADFCVEGNSKQAVDEFGVEDWRRGHRLDVDQVGGCFEAR